MRMTATSVRSTRIFYFLRPRSSSNTHATHTPHAPYRKGCYHADAPDAFVIWGASTQGRVPFPPLTGTDASTNSIGVARGVQLQDLLAKYFE